jgi:hypothetical protein
MTFLKPFLILSVFAAHSTAFAHSVRGVVVQFKDLKALNSRAEAVSKLAINSGLALAETNEKYEFIRYSRPAESKIKIFELKRLCESIEKQKGVDRCQLEIESVGAQAHVGQSEATSPSLLVAETDNSKKLFGCLALSPHPLESQRSKYWAQMYTGADLAREEVASFVNATPSLASHRVRIAAIDDSRSPSSTAANNSGPDTSGPSHGDEVIALIKDSQSGHFGGSTEASFKEGDKGFFDAASGGIYDHATKVANRPKDQRFDVINFSMGVKRVNTSQVSGAARLNQVLNGSKSVLVVAAGNEYPTHEKEKENLNNSIVVGNMAATGYPSASSSEFKDVFIHAPSASRNDYGGNTLTAIKPDFGGTSGAAPQVSATVANLKQLLPGVSLVAIKAILARTAIQTPASLQEPQLNGVGMLNSLGAVEAAKKIAAVCLKRAESKRSTCFDEQSQSSSNYQQAANPSLYAKLNKYFPNCGMITTDQPLSRPQEASCTELQDLFRELRFDAYRNPQVATNWTYLGCVYNGSQFRVESDFYYRLGMMGWPPDRPKYKARLEETSHHSYYLPTEYLRVFPDTKKLWKIFKEDSNLIERVRAGSILMKHDPNAEAEFRSLIESEQWAKLEFTEKLAIAQALNYSNKVPPEIKSLLAAYKGLKNVVDDAALVELIEALALRHSEASLNLALRNETDPIKKEALEKALKL